MPVEVSPSIPQRLIPNFSVLCWLIGGNARYLNTRLVRGDVSHCNIRVFRGTSCHGIYARYLFLIGDAMEGSAGTLRKLSHYAPDLCLGVSEFRLALPSAPRDKVWRFLRLLHIGSNYLLPLQHRESNSSCLSMSCPDPLLKNFSERGGSHKMPSKKRQWVIQRDLPDFGEVILEVVFVL